MNDNGELPSVLVLRTGEVAIITRTINKRAGLVTNKRVIITGLGYKIVSIKFTEQDVLRIHEIPRIPLMFKPGTNNLESCRVQFPPSLSYAITYNKAQGMYNNMLLKTTS